MDMLGLSFLCAENRAWFFHVRFLGMILASIQTFWKGAIPIKVQFHANIMILFGSDSKPWYFFCYENNQDLWIFIPQKMAR